MKRSMRHSPTRDVQPVIASARCQCSIASAHRRLADGHGTLSVLSADDRPAKNMARHTRLPATHACGDGAKPIHRLQKRRIAVRISKRNMACRQNRLSQCEKRKGESVPSVIGSRRVYLLTTATPAARFAAYFVKRATRFLAGTRARLNTSFDSRSICWVDKDKPCHADVLLEIANQPSGGAA